MNKSYAAGASGNAGASSATSRVTPRLRHIPFRRLGTTEMHLRYLEDEQDLTPFLGARPRDAADLLRRAPMNARRLVPGTALAKALLAYAERHGAPDPVLENARVLADDRVFCVITGQQPGLFGGPLYTVHKAATAVRLARELSAVPNAPRVVPLFWNHSDDHDLDEANRLFLVNPAMEVQRFRLELDRTGEPLRSIATGREMQRLLAAVGELLPDNEHRAWALSLFTPRHPDETLGTAMARMMFALFGEHGLLVIEPRDLPAEAFAPLERWWKDADRIRDRVRQTCDELSDVGIDVTMDPAATLMFEVVGSQREPLADGEAFGQRTDLSPGALLRPLWQDACLPSIAFVVGPGELAYLSVVAPLYRALGVPQPPFVPRASLTLVEPSLQRLLGKFGWDLPDLEPGPERLAQSLQGELGDGIDDEVDDLARRVQAELAALGERIAKLDASMLAAVDRARAKATEELSKLAQKVRQARQNKEGTGLRQIRRLCSNLRPRGRLQERVLPPIGFLAAHGPALASWLIDAADPFRAEHGVLEL